MKSSFKAASSGEAHQIATLNKTADDSILYHDIIFRQGTGLCAKHFNSSAWEVLVGEKSHLRRGGENSFRLQRIVSIAQARKNGFVRYVWIIFRDFGFRPAFGQKPDDELHGQPRPTDHWLACQDFGIENDQ
jgi:hypothetical protein